MNIRRLWRPRRVRSLGLRNFSGAGNRRRKRKRRGRMRARQRRKETVRKRERIYIIPISRLRDWSRASETPRSGGDDTTLSLSLSFSLPLFSSAPPAFIYRQFGTKDALVFFLSIFLFS